MGEVRVENSSLDGTPPPNVSTIEVRAAEGIGAEPRVVEDRSENELVSDTPDLMARGMRNVVQRAEPQKAEATLGAVLVEEANKRGEFERKQ